ncbi:hypothetical protein NM208_g11921 [Fusarium decemcellulare]|uniref:Uncharacterized protein n=1 Tax=Fusarium decemcellulare TaxID=57161 RepID=A0ACC1RS35_9HYPO|nr:hypothetical protein NM208_g11921 [Fusarium decemcellulare]
MAPAPSGAAVLVSVKAPLLRCSFKDRPGKAPKGTIFSLITLVAILIAARVYLRLVIQKQRLLASDMLMVAAWCSALTTASFDIVLKNNGVLEADVNYTLVNWIMWVGAIPFFTTFYLCKASLLAVYLQLFPPFMLKRRMALWAVIVYCALAYLATIFVQLFACFPIQRNWDIDHPETMCNGDPVALIFQVAWVLHFVGSLALFVLPFLIVYNLNMRLKMKVGVYCVFLLGLVDIAFSLTRFLTVQLSNEGDFRSITTIELWSALDVYVGLIIACLPALRPYLRRGFGSSYQYSNNESARPARSLPSRRAGQNGFEEIDEEGPIPVGVEAGIRATRTRGTADSLNLSVDDGWADKKSNGSDIELVTIDVSVPVKEHI